MLDLLSRIIFLPVYAIIDIIRMILNIILKVCSLIVGVLMIPWIIFMALSVYTKDWVSLGVFCSMGLVAYAVVFVITLLLVLVERGKDKAKHILIGNDTIDGYKNF